MIRFLKLILRSCASFIVLDVCQEENFIYLCYERQCAQTDSSVAKGD